MSISSASSALQSNNIVQANANVTVTHVSSMSSSHGEPVTVMLQETVDQLLTAEKDIKAIVP